MAKVENLTVQYGGTAVLENFSAEFPDGGVTAVSGRSGCGKTTLLAVLLGLLRPDGGTVSGFRQPSAVFQEDRLLPFLSAEKNIAVTAGCTEAEAGEALLSVGFDAADRGKRAFELSGGMARRVAIVRAMLAPGDAVLLDEPFKGLDERTRAGRPLRLRKPPRPHDGRRDARPARRRGAARRAHGADGRAARTNG